MGLADWLLNPGWPASPDNDYRLNATIPAVNKQCAKEEVFFEVTITQQPLLPSHTRDTFDVLSAALPPSSATAPGTEHCKMSHAAQQSIFFSSGNE